MRAVILLAAVLATASAHAQLPAQIDLRDDAGQTLRLAQPARRVVSLSPHLTELLFAAGAGANVVGALEYSDFPPAARGLPRIGDDATLDLERIVALKPDLALAWPSAGHRRQLDRLPSLGVPVFRSEQRELEDIAHTLEVFGALTGHANSAAKAARDFRSRAAELTRRHANRPAVRVFFQVWGSPLVTVNGAHLISKVLRMCGGENVFAALPILAPQVDLEAVLAANPEAIIASRSGPSTDGWRAAWRSMPAIAAVRAGNLFEVPAELIERHTPRVLDGAGRVCADLDAARARRR